MDHLTNYFSLLRPFSASVTNGFRPLTSCNVPSLETSCLNRKNTANIKSTKFEVQWHTNTGDNKVNYRINSRRECDIKYYVLSSQGHWQNYLAVWQNMFGLIVYFQDIMIPTCTYLKSDYWHRSPTTALYHIYWSNKNYIIMSIFHSTSITNASFIIG